MNICKGSHLDGTMLLGRLLVLSVLILNRLLPDMKINYLDKHHNHVNMLDNHICIGDYHFCLLGFSSHSRMFYSYGDVTFAVEGLQILTYVTPNLPLDYYVNIRLKLCCISILLCCMLTLIFFMWTYIYIFVACWHVVAEVCNYWFWVAFTTTFVWIPLTSAMNVTRLQLAFIRFFIIFL